MAYKIKYSKFVKLPANAPPWWLVCVKLGSSNIVFLSGVGVGLASNVFVAGVFSYSTCFPLALGCMFLSAGGFTALSWHLHKIAFRIQEGEAHCPPKADKVQYAAGDSWGKAKGEDEREKFVRGLLAASVSLLIAIFALVCGVFVLPNRVAPTPQIGKLLGQEHSPKTSSSAVAPPKASTPDSRKNSNAPDSK